MSIYQNHSYKNDLNWLYFDDDQQSYISASMVYPTYTGSNREHHPRYDNSIQRKAIK